MDKQMAFKKQMFGFDKKMVIHYIEDAYQKSSSEEERLTSRIKELEGENEGLKQKVKEDSEAMQSLYERIGTETNNAMRLAEAVKSLTAETNRQKLDQNQKDYKIKQLSNKLEEQENRETEVQEIKKAAEAIRAQALREAEAIKAKAESDANGIVYNARKEHDRMLLQVEEFRNDIESLKASLKETLRKIEDQVDQFGSDIGEQFTEQMSAETKRVFSGSDTPLEEHFFRPAAQRS